MAVKKRSKNQRKKGFIARLMSWPRPLVAALLFGLIGVSYFVFQTFAASNTVHYWGALTSKNPTAKYSLTTGTGNMRVSFSNNTADVELTVKNSAGAVIGSLKSIGKQDVFLSVPVTAGTHTVSLKTNAAFRANKGYSIYITYPLTDLAKPSAVITAPITNQTVKDYVDFAATAKDDTGIVKVEFYVDNVALGADTTAPYGIKWDTKLSTNGVHNLGVKSYDTDGNVGTATGVVTVANTTTTLPPVSANRKPFGMSAPDNMWSLRLAEVGGPEYIKFRRIFYQGFDSSFKLVQESINAGMVPIISFKVNPYSWSQVASGAADAKIKAMVSRLNAIPGEKFVALHHEPAKDGTAKDWSNMQVHALPLIKSNGNNIKVGVIGNGWWWSNQANGYTDAEIAQWITPKVIAVSDVIAADTYQNANLSESGGPKIKNMGSWARRVGGVKALGIGEFNGLTPLAITEAMNAVKAEPLVAWACMWNSQADGLVGRPLEGARLEAFKRGLATTAPTQ